jgi:hypothetical protein
LGSRLAFGFLLGLGWNLAYSYQFSMAGLVIKTGFWFAVGLVIAILLKRGLKNEKRGLKSIKQGLKFQKPGL